MEEIYFGSCETMIHLPFILLRNNKICILIVRLKSEKLIEKLFKDGNALFVYPIKILYRRQLTEANEAKFQVGYSVSKRNFKRAVDRNRIKRLLRETVRTNYSTYNILHDLSIDLMVIYVSKEMLEYDILNKTTSKIFKKLVKDVKSKQEH
jgi:ribonuclease P protein component